MFPTFVIGLREGLEAALIIGIISAFMAKNVAPDRVTKALRQVWLGVGIAIALCLVVGVGLQMLSEGLPQRQQEMLECVIAAVAVIMISYMILWMNKHSRGLKGELELAAADALASGSTKALVIFAFLAVLREGFETAVFLVAAFQNTNSPVQAFTGITLGLLLAVALGYLVYRGGISLNLSRFFRITGVVLVLVAGGLVVSTLRAAFEAGWLAAGQQTALDLTGIITPGTVQASLIGGIFGIQPQMAAVELVGWLLFVIPMLTLVLWPRRRRLTSAAAGRLLPAIGGLGLLIAVSLAVFAPAKPTDVVGDQGPFAAVADISPGLDLRTAEVIAAHQSSGSVTVQVLSVDSASMSARVQVSPDAAGRGDIDLDIQSLTAVGHRWVGGGYATEYVGKATSVAIPPGADGLPETITGQQLAALNNGRYPIGVSKNDADNAMPVVFTDSTRPTIYLDQASGVVVGAQLKVSRTMQFTTAGGVLLSGGTVASQTVSVTESASAGQVALIADRTSAESDHELWGRVIPVEIAIFALVLVAFGFSSRTKGRRVVSPVAREPATVS